MENDRQESSKSCGISRRNVWSMEDRDDAVDIQTLTFRVIELSMETSGFTTENLRLFQDAAPRLYTRARNCGYTIAADIYKTYADNLLELLRDDGSRDD